MSVADYKAALEALRQFDPVPGDGERMAASIEAEMERLRRRALLLEEVCDVQHELSKDLVRIVGKELPRTAKLFEDNLRRVHDRTEAP